ncbi:MAG: hypothetical protein LUD01_01545 [Clostridiales bacterium]|nr:hypothetical protein [Clostridiales bacterium]
MKKLSVAILIAGMSAMCVLAGCGNSSSADSADVTAETEETNDAEAADTEEESEEDEETEAADTSETVSSGSSSSSTSGTTDAGTADSSSDTAESAMAEDTFAGSYVNSETGMYLEIEVSETGEADYQLTWSNGTDWTGDTYGGLAQDGYLLVTIEMNYDAQLTIEKTSDGLSVTGDDNYNDNVVENRRLDGSFSKYE